MAKKLLAFFLWLLLIANIFQFLPNTSYALDCNAKSICSPIYKGLNPPTPGAACATDPDHYVWGKSDTCFGDKPPCVPKCGFLGDGYCCDAKPGVKAPTPTPQGFVQPPPCAQGGIASNGNCGTVDTAFGKINTDAAALTTQIFRILLSLSGGVAILLIVASGFQMATSQGNPEKVKEARERLTAAIVGLVFIIFSITILRIIGVDILHIPGFSAK